MLIAPVVFLEPNMMLGVLIYGFAAAVLGGLVLWYGRSRTGTRIKAMVGNPDLARALGIPVRRYAAATFVVGTCLAGLAGVLIAPLAPVRSSIVLIATVEPCRNSPAAR